MKVTDYMRMVAEDDSPRKLIMWPRRAGKTEYVVQSAIKDMLLGKKVIIVSINKALVNLIHDRIRDEFKSNILLQHYRPFISRDVQAPFNRFEMVRPFGQIISFSGGQTKTSICGQDADSIYVDEGCYISRKTYTGTILPILQTTPNTSIEILFTPIVIDKSKQHERKSGGKFIKAVWDEAPQWEHFHIDYRWLKFANEMRKMKDIISWDSWRTEHLAEWVEKE